MALLETVIHLRSYGTISYVVLVQTEGNKVIEQNLTVGLNPPNTKSRKILLQGIKMGKPGILITDDDSPEGLIQDVKRFGWNLEQHAREGKLLVSMVISAKSEIVEMVELVVVVVELVETKYHT
jgi:hypothetical protein